MCLIEAQGSHCSCLWKNKPDHAVEWSQSILRCSLHSEPRAFHLWVVYMCKVRPAFQCSLAWALRVLLLTCAYTRKSLLFRTCDDERKKNAQMAQYILVTFHVGGYCDLVTILQLLHCGIFQTYFGKLLKQNLFRQRSSVGSLRGAIPRCLAALFVLRSLSPSLPCTVALAEWNWFFSNF